MVDQFYKMAHFIPYANIVYTSNLPVLFFSSFEYMGIVFVCANPGNDQLLPLERKRKGPCWFYYCGIRLQAIRLESVRSSLAKYLVLSTIGCLLWHPGYYLGNHIELLLPGRVYEYQVASLAERLCGRDLLECLSITHRNRGVFKCLRGSGK